MWSVLVDYILRPVAVTPAPFVGVIGRKSLTTNH